MLLYRKQARYENDLFLLTNPVVLTLSDSACFHHGVNEILTKYSAFTENHPISFCVYFKIIQDCLY